MLDSPTCQLTGNGNSGLGEATMAKDDFKFNTSLRVRWGECDPQGIVYNGSYLDYLEVGQAEYYRNLGFSIYKLAERGFFDTVLAKVTLEFLAPARVDDLLDVYVRVHRIGDTSLAMDMEIYVERTERLLSRGEAIYVGYQADTETTRPVPPDIRELIENYEKSGTVLSLERFPDLASLAY